MSDAVEFSSETRLAAIAATRTMVAEETFDTILATLIDFGTLSREQAAIMCDRLANRLGEIDAGLHHSQWMVHHRELKHHRDRLQERAALIRGGFGEEPVRE